MTNSEGTTMRNHDTDEPVEHETPWGKVVESGTIAKGIKYFETERHGGYWVSPRRFAEMPEQYRTCSMSRDNWFEEDSAYCAVPLSFPQHFDDGWSLDRAADTYASDFKATESERASKIDQPLSSSRQDLASTLSAMRGDLDLRSLHLTMQELRPSLADTVRYLVQQPPNRQRTQILAHIALHQARTAANQCWERSQIFRGMPQDVMASLSKVAGSDDTLVSGLGSKLELIDGLARMPPNQKTARALGSIALIEMRDVEHQERQLKLMRDHIGSSKAAGYFLDGLAANSQKLRYGDRRFSAAASAALDTKDRDNTGR